MVFRAVFHLLELDRKPLAMAVSRPCWNRLALALLATGTANGARAADLPPPPTPIAQPVAVGSGWYLRGDFTESVFDRPHDATRPDPNDPGMPPLVGLRLSREPGYGGGVGYRINEWLRVDATIDQRTPAAFSAYSSRSNFVTGRNLEAGDLSALTGLVNVYADLGTWWGFTPYIGAGVGVAQKDVHHAYTQTTCFVDGCDGAPGSGARTAVARPDKSVASLAWALTAGLSHAVGAGFSIDAAYRYVDFGRAKSGTDPYGGSTRLKDLTANEFRIGLRYQFANGLLPGAFGPASPYGN